MKSFTGINSVDEYWAMLSDYNAGYQAVEDMWVNNIDRLHRRIVKFVQTRLTANYANDYKIANETLPAHLLGSLQGYDWTQLSMSIVPYPNKTFEIRKNLLNNSLVGENLYKSASNLGNVLLKHVPEAKFWKDSDFYAQCPSHLINLCKGNVRLMTCSDHSSIRNYVSAHKDVANILIHQMSIDNSPILNEANRYSGKYLFSYLYEKYTFPYSYEKYSFPYSYQKYSFSYSLCIFVMHNRYA